MSLEYIVENKKVIFKKAHGYHMVLNSPWPILLGGILLSTIIELIAQLQEHQRNEMYLIMNAIMFFIIIMRWGSDIHIEASYEGRHTKIIQKLLKQGFFLFILSEIMFFAALFGSYIYIITHPNIWIGCEWPPIDLFQIDPMKLPLANAFLLVMSGMWGETAHDTIKLGLGQQTAHYIGILMVLGLCFLGVQLHEYTSAPFGIDDGIYGTLFYFITGFHGLHVTFGLLFIFVQYYRINIGAITRNHHVGFSLSMWYWHFVDIVWLIVWFLIYYYPLYT
jgi:heme/copper-type cytochrome/quinol oxidase subunit 3